MKPTTPPRILNKRRIVIGLIVLLVIGTSLFFALPSLSYHLGFSDSKTDHGLVDAPLPENLKPSEGVGTIRDHEHFHSLSYQGKEVLLDKYLAGLEFVKFTLDQALSDDPQLYFINTKKYRAHTLFAKAVGLPVSSPFSPSDDQMKGVLIYRPQLKSPSGKQGLYTFEFEPVDAYSFQKVKLCHDLLKKKMPTLKSEIGFAPRGEESIAKYNQERALYDESDIHVYLDDKLTDTAVRYLPLNLGSTFGRLRVMTIEERPDPRDIVLYDSLPNTMPRVAGIITSVRQTPLSHVNLRAVQDNIPNAFIAGAAQNALIEPLIGKLVFYQVRPDDFLIREATPDEAAAHFFATTPA